jgi:hypothetical protein
MDSLDGLEKKAIYLGMTQGQRKYPERPARKHGFIKFKVIKEFDSRFYAALVESTGIIYLYRNEDKFKKSMNWSIGFEEKTKIKFSEQQSVYIFATETPFSRVGAKTDGILQSKDSTSISKQPGQMFCLLCQKSHAKHARPHLPSPARYLRLHRMQSTIHHEGSTTFAFILQSSDASNSDATIEEHWLSFIGHTSRSASRITSSLQIH